jgi:uncharacterized protein
VLTHFSTRFHNPWIVWAIQLVPFICYKLALVVRPIRWHTGIRTSEEDLSLNTSRAKIRRHPDRAVPDEVGNILAEGLVAHIGFVVDGQPYVIPMNYSYDPVTLDTIYVHGAVASRLMQHMVTGAALCVTITLVDGIVYSRDAQDHSMNYRSLIGFGRATVITDDAEKAKIFEAMTQHYIPGRTVGFDYTAPEPGHLHATTLVAIAIEEWSAKARFGGPRGPHDNDPDAPGTAGVVELRQVRGCTQTS